MTKILSHKSLFLKKTICLILAISIAANPVAIFANKFTDSLRAKVASCKHFISNNKKKLALSAAGLASLTGITIAGASLLISKNNFAKANKNIIIPAITPPTAPITESIVITDVSNNIAERIKSIFTGKNIAIFSAGAAFLGIVLLLYSQLCKKNPAKKDAQTEISSTELEDLDLKNIESKEIQTDNPIINNHAQEAQTESPSQTQEAQTDNITGEQAQSLQKKSFAAKFNIDGVDSHNEQEEAIRAHAIQKEALEMKKKEIEAELAEKTSALEKIREEVKLKQAEIKTQDMELAKNQEEARKKQKEIETQNSELAKREEEARRKLDEIAALETEYKSRRAAHDRASSQVAGWENSVQENSEKNIVLLEQLKTQEKELEKKRTENTAKLAKLEQEEKRRASEIKAQNTEILNQHDQLSKNMRALKEEKTSLEEEISELKAEETSIRATIEKLQKGNEKTLQAQLSMNMTIVEENRLVERYLKTHMDNDKVRKIFQAKNNISEFVLANKALVASILTKECDRLESISKKNELERQSLYKDLAKLKEGQEKLKAEQAELKTRKKFIHVKSKLLNHFKSKGANKEKEKDVLEDEALSDEAETLSQTSAKSDGKSSSKKGKKAGAGNSKLSGQKRTSLKRVSVQTNKNQ